MSVELLRSSAFPPINRDLIKNKSACLLAKQPNIKTLTFISNRIQLLLNDERDLERALYAPIAELFVIGRQLLDIISGWML